MDLNTTNNINTNNYPTTDNADLLTENTTQAVQTGQGVNTTPTTETYGPNQNEAAIYEPSTQSTEYKTDFDTLRALWAEHEAKVDSFRRLIESLLTKQADRFDLAYDVQGRPLWTGDEMVEIDEETRAAARAEIEEGGYYSVDETAKRLLNFAVALTGGDPSKVELMRDAVQKGYEDAERMWGGELPEISQQTLAAVMNGFDEWAEAGNAGAISLLA